MRNLEIEEIQTLSGLSLKKVKALNILGEGSWKYFLNNLEVVYWSYQRFPDNSFESIAIKFKEMELPNTKSSSPSRGVDAENSVQ